MVRRFLSFAPLCALLVVALMGAAQAAPVFPVKYSANKRYLVDQNNVPFPIMGRTSWFITSLPVGDYQTFLDDTAARGFNTIEFHVLNHDPRGNNAPVAGNDTVPFLKRLDGGTWSGTLFYGNINNEAPDFTTPNETYWSHVDGLLAYAESKGILVFMFPAYVGYNGQEQGYLQEMVANGATKMQTYGTWIANRYKNQKNLVWMMGGDMGTAPIAFNTAQTAVEIGLLNGIKAVSAKQSAFFSAEWQSESIGTDQLNLGSSMTLNSTYSWTGREAYHGRRAYSHVPTEPAFLLEEPYDQEGPDADPFGTGTVNPSATQPVRRFQWWGWLSAIGGYISGNGYVWPFNSGWQGHLDTVGTHDNMRLNDFMNSIPWYNLVPSGLGGMRNLIVAGGGSATTNSDYTTYVAAAATPDGKLLVAYIPPDHNGSITVDMGAMSGKTRARWLDPTSAAYSSAAGGYLANSGTLSFNPPSNNSAGASDWVLVLDVPDITDPALKITGPTATPALTNTTGTINLVGTASDNSAVAQISWSDNQGGSGSATGISSWSVPGIKLAPGLNLLTVTATDTFGNSTQAVLSVLYRVPPSFTQQPQAQSAATNDSITFSAGASGDQPLNFQWRKNGAVLLGATNATYTIDDVTPLSAANYSVTVNNLAGTVTSSNALLKVFIPPALLVQPIDRAVIVGGKTAFAVKATGTLPLYYQWRLNDADIPGATGPVYAFFGIQTNAAGNYTVAVSNFAGVRVSSNAVLTVNVPPKFVLQPPSQPLIAGPTNITLTVAASGTTPIRYQWLKNGKSILGETNTSYTVTNAAFDTFYSVLAVNVAGTAISSNALLKVFTHPAVVAQPLARTVTAGGSASFVVKAIGTLPLFYQWQKDGDGIPGATNFIYTLTSIQATQAGAYSVVVSNFAGVAVSSNAVLTVNVPPSFTSQPQSLLASLGANLSFTATATGTEPLKYRWRKNGANILGATNTSYAIDSLVNLSLGNYSVVVANVAGTIVSSNAVLGLLPLVPKSAPLEVPPFLNAAIAGNQLVLSWDTNASGFNLQSTPDLSTWDLLPPPDISDDRYVVTNSLANPARFYRLVK